MNQQKKKYKIPIAFRFLRWAFPKVEAVSPYLAKKWAAKLFFTPIKFGTPSAEKPYLKMADKFNLYVEEKKVSCYTWGTGEPIIFVHGWSGRGTQFWKFIEYFTKNGFKVISFDAPAHGLSSGKTTSILEFENIIRQLAEKFDVHHLIGHSLGGVASLLAAKNGLKVKNLFMIGSPSIADEVISEFLKKINGTQASSDGIRNYVKQRTDRPFEDFMSLQIIQGINDLNLKLIHDEYDSEVPIKHAEELIKRYPRATIFKTSGLGHTRILKDQVVIEECMNQIKKSA
ncbi:MAG: alpha/beta hydrolase [Cyclobacteriaceae bacterium]|nr:alpha/beta hydrolase [Cyclobacteriaceae bacterium]